VGFVLLDLLFYMYVLSIVVCPFVLFLLAIVLSVLLRYTLFFQQYFSYIVAVSFIGGGNRRKLLTYRKSLTNFITYVVSSTSRHERGSNSQL